MNAQDHTEKVLKELYRLVSQSTPYPRDPEKVIVEKKPLEDLLNELGESMQSLFEDYELTRESRDRAERQLRRSNDEMVKETKRRAEDIYAATMLYSNDALEKVWQLMHEATDSMERIYEELDENLRKQEKKVRGNQLEIRSQLQDLKDADKYLGLIEDRNKEIAKQNTPVKNRIRDRRKNMENRYADRQTEIRINQDVLKKLGISGDAAEDNAAAETPEAKAVVRVNERFGPEHKPELSPKKGKEKKEKSALVESVKEMVSSETLEVENLNDIDLDEALEKLEEDIPEMLLKAPVAPEDIPAAAENSTAATEEPSAVPAGVHSALAGNANSSVGDADFGDMDGLETIDLEASAVDWKGDSLEAKKLSKASKRGGFLFRKK